LKRHGLGAAVLTCVLLLTLLPAAAAARAFSPGAPGAGDPFFPLAGNGGYDVSHYRIAFAYTPKTRHLRGSAVITASATQDLSRFDLDLRGFTVSQVRVDGRATSFSRDGQELVVTPPSGIADGTRFAVEVRYAGRPSVITDPDGSIEGWVPTADGAFVVGEPQGSTGWYPVNDTPADKATFDFVVTVPRGITVMANGVLVWRQSGRGRTTWCWHEGDLMAPYLATATLGRFDLTQSRVGRTPAYVAVDHSLKGRKVLRKLPAIVRYYASLFGPYPFSAVGAVVDHAPRVGYALETQTKPVFDRMPDEATLAHELAHQWFGDSVTLTQWPDIWLHEGFATWCEWIWGGHEGGKSAATWFRQLYKVPASRTSFWDPPSGDPGTPADLFATSVYARGGMTLEALREKVGTATFLDILRTWAQQHEYGNVTTPQFIALCEQKCGMDLDAFFQAWLYTEGKPTAW
jgi:aminopeptidase N